MPTNNNTEVSRKLRDGLKINQAIETVPTRVADSIVPVFEVSPEKLIQVAEADVHDGGAGVSLTTLHTTHATRKTYLVGALISVAKDVLSISKATSILATIFGKKSVTGQTIIAVMYEPLTAGNHSQFLMFTYPILLEKGTAVTLLNLDGTASIDTHGFIYFYEED